MKLGDIITRDFTTHDPLSGQVSDADVLPTCDVFEDMTDVPMLSPVVTKRAGLVGDYRVTFSCTSANGFEIDKSYNVIVTATVNGVTAKSRIASFYIRAEVVGALPKAHFMT